MSPHNTTDLREIYALLREIKADLASMKTSTAIDHGRIDSCEQKIDKVESTLDRMAGAKGVMAFILSALGAFLLLLLQIGYEAIKNGGR